MVAVVFGTKIKQVDFFCDGQEFGTKIKRLYSLEVYLSFHLSICGKLIFKLKK